MGWEDRVAHTHPADTQIAICRQPQIKLHNWTATVTFLMKLEMYIFILARELITSSKV